MVLPPPERSRRNADSSAFRAGVPLRRRAIIITMASTSLIALAATVLSGSAGANDAASHVVAVATARATIVAGARVGSNHDLDDHREPPQPADTKPRERPCPENAQTPCRLIVTDLQ
jgi:hypothetical protein